MIYTIAKVMYPIYTIAIPTIIPFYLRTITGSLQHQHILIQNSEKLLDFPSHFLDLLCKLACNKGIRIQNLIIFVLSNGGAVLFVTASGILSVLKDLCK